MKPKFDELLAAAVKPGGLFAVAESIQSEKETLENRWVGPFYTTPEGSEEQTAYYCDQQTNTSTYESPMAAIEYVSQCCEMLFGQAERDSLVEIGWTGRG
jgi:hypothetical protein